MANLDSSDEATPSGASPSALLAKPPLGRHTLPIAFAIVGLILAAIPLVPEVLGGGMDKDYPR